MYACLRSGRPVKIVARLAAQMDVVTKQFSKRTPCAARLSILGVCTIGCPAQPRVSFRWSSVRRNIIFGCFGEAVSFADAGSFSVRQPPKNINAAAVTTKIIRNRLLFTIIPFLDLVHLSGKSP